MNERPDQPPEGKLIAAATERSGLSIREASKRAGISYGRWRQVTSGVQHVSPGNFASVHAPARTLAKMAAAVGVTPEQLETEGQRPDAAQALRDLRQHEPAGPAEAPAVQWPIPPQENSPFNAQSLLAAAPFSYEISGRLRDLRDQGIERPSGDEMFPDDPRASGSWDTVLAAGLSPEHAMQFVATLRGEDARARERGRAGTRGA